MPGLTLLFNKEPELLPGNGKEKKLLKRALLEHNQKTRLLFGDETFSVFLNTYKSYPVSVFDDGQFTIIIEGKVYNYQHGVVAEMIREKAGRFENSDFGKSFVLRDLISVFDGDFIIYVYDKLNRQVIFANDSMARLPVYVYDTPNRMVVSREIAFVREYSGAGTDKYGLSQFLLTGYPWGTNTLYLNISYMKAGTEVHFKPDGSIMLFESAPIDFSQKLEVGFREASRKLSELFTTSVSTRIKDKKGFLLSLSGGLDSRAILGACRNLMFDMGCATYLDHNKACLSDVIIAEELAASFNASLDIIGLQPTLGKYFLELLTIKQGLNYLGMSFILGFFDQIRNRTRKYITGDGGDKLLPDLRPGIPLKTRSGLLNYILRHHGVFSFNDTVKLTGIEPGELFDYLMATIEQYPENNLNDKYHHFVFYERTCKWLFEGEDRNRYYFWNVAPFYSLPLVNYSLQLPPGLKANYRLYIAFLNHISPRLNYINNANWGFPPSSNKLARYLYYRQLKSASPLFIKNLKNRMKKQANYLQKNTEVNMVKVFNKQVGLIGNSGNFLNYNHLFNMKHLSEDQFYHALTISSLNEMMDNRLSSISDFAFIEFDV